MSRSRSVFVPVAPLLPGYARKDCRVCITIPARNEGTTLARCLAALARQVDLQGGWLPRDSFEILLLLNNCSDDSADVARAWKASHADVDLHVAERTLCANEAHVGTARRWLMDTAWHRLAGDEVSLRAIMTTDADTVVSPDFVAQNLQALREGADVVGGYVDIDPADFRLLPAKVAHCYKQDRRYAHLVAQLEDLLDPQHGDPWPRHLDHFGSALACSPEAYALAGGMPAVSPLEDEAFIDQVRRAGLCLRHEPKVRVFTSTRLDGRASIGLASQFRLWTQLPGEDAHLVPSAEILEHRFRTLRRLRVVFATKELTYAGPLTARWRDTFQRVLQETRTCAEFLAAIDANRFIAEVFYKRSEAPIRQVIVTLQKRIDDLTRQPTRTTREANAGMLAAQGGGTLSDSVQ